MSREWNLWVIVGTKFKSHDLFGSKSHSTQIIRRMPESARAWKMVPWGSIIRRVVRWENHSDTGTCGLFSAREPRSASVAVIRFCNSKSHVSSANIIRLATFSGEQEAREGWIPLNWLDCRPITAALKHQHAVNEVFFNALDVYALTKSINTLEPCDPVQTPLYWLCRGLRRNKWRPCFLDLGTQALELTSTRGSRQHRLQHF